ncbi:MAG: CopG family ribbon-helix-helix protein [Beijerinckiaceae bacterium]
MRIDAHLKQQLDEIERVEKRSSASVLQRAAEEYVQRHNAFNDRVERLEAEADRGAFVSEEAMTRWFASLGADPEAQSPQPDLHFKPD